MRSITRQPFPSVGFDDGYQGLNVDSCCTVTHETDTQWSFSSTMTKNIGRHIMKFGGERRIFLNNFFNPATLRADSSSDKTSPRRACWAAAAPMMWKMATTEFDAANFPDSGSVLFEVPAVANKSMESSFFFQDEWRVTPKLSLNRAALSVEHSLHGAF